MINQGKYIQSIIVPSLKIIIKYKNNWKLISSVTFGKMD